MVKSEINTRLLRESNLFKSFLQYYDSENVTKRTKSKKKCKINSPCQWTMQEDQQLIELVATKDNKNISWSIIGKAIGSRSGKQCRERYVNHLDPSINKDEWSFEEDFILIKCQNLFGNKWAMFSKQFLIGRTDNSIKNRYHCISRNKQDLLKTNLNVYFSHISSQMDDIDYEIIRLWNK
mgnify:CR=1 FL=1